jgi:hypothetical protein
MTLIEAMLAVVLLSAVTAGGMLWVRAALSAVSGREAASRWRSAAEASVRMLHDDLAEVTCLPSGERVRVSGDRLVLVAGDGDAAGRAACVVYERLGSRLIRIEREPDGVDAMRLLVGDVSGFAFETDAESGAMEVVVVSRCGARVARRLGVRP